MYLAQMIKESWHKEIAIHCITKAQANLLFEKLKKLDIKWYVTNDSVNHLNNFWDFFKEKTFYILTDGKLSYSAATHCMNCGYDLIDFNSIDDFNHSSKNIEKEIYHKNMLIVCKEKKYVLLKYDGKDFKIQCHEQDKFDWRIGFGLALSQVFGKQAKWKEHREYYRDNKKRKLDFKQYALWCIVEYFDNDMLRIDELGKKVKEIKENGKVDL